MADAVTQIENAATAPLGFARKNPIGFALLLLVGVLVLLHFSGAINRWIAGRAAGGSGVWVKVGRWTGAVAAVVCMGLLLRDAASAYHAHGLLTMGTGLLSLASAFAFPQPDFVALKDENGNYLSSLTPGIGIAERKFILSAPRETINGFPLKVTDVEFRATMVLDNSDADSGSTILWDELFQMIAGLEIVSPRFGTICDKNSYSGPVAKHCGEYIGNGYAYSGDESFAVISSGTGDQYTVTIYVTYPVMARYLAKPEESAMFVGWLQGTQLKFNLAAASAIGAASTGSTIAGNDVKLACGYRQFLSVGHGKPASQYTVPPLAYRRTLLTPANGQFDVVFSQVSATGPQNTNVSNGERLVAAVLLSNNLGLPGPGTFEAVTELGCTGLGLLNTYNPDQWIKAKIPNERRSIQGVAQLGWPYTIQAHSPISGENQFTIGSQLVETLLGIPFALPGVAQKISKLPRVKGDLTVHALQPTPPNGGGKQYAMYVETLRDIDGGYAAQLLAAAGVSAPVTRHVGHDAEAAVRSGRVRAAQYTGLPQGPKT